VKNAKSPIEVAAPETKILMEMRLSEKYLQQKNKNWLGIRIMGEKCFWKDE